MLTGGTVDEVRDLTFACTCKTDLPLEKKLRLSSTRILGKALHIKISKAQYWQKGVA